MLKKKYCVRKPSGIKPNALNEGDKALKINKKLSAFALAFLLSLTIMGSTNEAAAISAASKTTNTSALPDSKTGTETQSDMAKYLHEEQFSEDHSMIGIASECTEYFKAGDWNISAASITLRFTATKLADGITISLNGQTFYSQKLISSTDGETQELTSKLPIKKIKSGQNSVTVNVYMASESDREANAKAESVMISKESSIALQYLPKAAVSTIAGFCEQFVSIDALENDQSAVAVRSDADNAELTAAARVLAGISGRATMYYDNIGLVTADDEQTLYSGKYRFYISKYSSLPANIADRLSAEEKQAAQNGAVMALLDGQNGGSVLLLTGSNEDAIVNAAKLIGNSVYLSQMKTTWRNVSADENVLMEKTNVDQYRQLTASGTSLTGLGEQSASYYIEFPNNRKLSYSSQISLSMRYSDNLNFDVSMVTAYINDEPIGSKKLSEEKTQGDLALFDIPSNMQISGNFTIKVLFDLEVKNDGSASAQKAAPWAWITSDSTLKLTSSNADSLIFENYPGPFVEDGAFNNSVVVLPDSPGTADLDAMRLILLTFGRNLEDNTGSLRIAHASSIGDVTSSNVISIGRYEKNLIAQQNNEKLFFKFNADGTMLSSNEKMLIDSNYGKSLGTVQLLVSPFSKEKYALMVVTGVSDEAMLHGIHYIGSEDNIWKIYGDGYVADGVSVFPYRFKIDNAKERSVVSQVLTRKDIRGVAYSAGLVIILALVAVIFLFRKYRKARQEDEK